MTDLNPGAPMGGGLGGGNMDRTSASRITQGPSNKWSVDSSDVTKLKTEIHGVVTEVSALEKAIGSLVSTLKGAAPQLAMLGGGKAAAPGGTGLTTAPFSGQGGGGGGNTNTTAPVSAFGGAIGKAANVLAFGAMGPTLSAAGGAINSYMSGVTAPGMASQLMSSQTSAIFGSGSNITSLSQARAGVGSLSYSDMAAAQSVEMANQMLYTRPGSRQQAAKFSFEKAAQQISPGMGAAGAAQFASTLASAGAMQMSNRILGTQKGILVNPNGSMNTDGTVFSRLMQVINKGRILNPAQLRQMAGDDATWQGVVQNFGSGTQMNLSESEITAMRQYAAAGGSVSAATKAQSGTVAASSLAKTTAITRRDQAAFQQGAGVQNAANRASAAANTGAANALNNTPMLGNAATAIGKLTSASLAAAGALAHIEEAAIAYKLLRGGGITGGGGGSAAGEGEAAVGGAATGGAGTAIGTVASTAAMALILKKMGNPVNLAKGGKSGFNPLHLPSYGKDLDQWIGHDSWSWLGDPPTGSTTTAGMQPSLAQSISAMRAVNPNIQISSGKRTAAQQAYLYAAKGGQGVARPGQSAHQTGHAADLGPPSQFGWIAKNASKFGLSRPAPKSEPWHVQTMGDPVSGSSAVSLAASQEGTPYVWGGETAGKGFDCSGLVQWVYKQLGINLPRTSQQQATSGTAVNGLSNAQPGDLLLYNEPGEGPNSHVAIYIGGGKQIAAPHTGTVVQVQSVDTTHLSTIRRVVGGGVGSAVVAAAQGAVGSASNDAANHSVSSGNTSVGLGNAFLASASGSWLANGMGGSSNQVLGAASGGTAASSSATSPSTGNTTVLPPSGGGISSPTAFSKAVLAGLGLSATSADVTDINAWQQHEGQWTVPMGPYNAAQMHDPLNTKLNMPGAKSLSGTMSYPTWAEGVAATVSTIKQQNMSGILKALQANANLSSFSSALEGTPWAQSGYGGSSFAQPSGVYAMGDPTAGAMGSGGVAVISGGRGSMGGGNTYHLHMPIQMTSGSQQDASQFVQTVLAELKRQSAVDQMSMS